MNLPLFGFYRGAGIRALVFACVLYGPSHLFSFVNQGFRKTEICAQRPQSWEGKGTSSSFKENAFVLTNSTLVTNSNFLLFPIFSRLLATLVLLIFV